MAKFYIKKQGIYAAEYNFADDDIDSEPDGWETGDPVSVTIKENLDGHKHIADVTYTHASPSMTQNFTGGTQNDGKIELYLYVSDASASWAFNIILYEGSYGTNSAFNIYIDSDKWKNSGGNIAAFDGVCDPTDDAWYHVKIVFDCDGTGGHGLAADQYEVTIREPDDTETDSGAINFDNARANIGSLLIQRTSGASTTYLYIDAIDYSWAAGYSEGRNLDYDANTEITDNITECVIDHRAREIPTAVMTIFGQTLEYDDIILVTDTYTSNVTGTLADQTIFEGRVTIKDGLYLQSIELNALSADLRETMPGDENTAYEPDGYAGTPTAGLGSKANYSEEVFAETINDKLSGAGATASVSTGEYRGELIGETAGTSGTDIDFVDSATLYNGACEIVASWQSHNIVIRLQDDATAGEDPYFDHNIVQATSGIFEFYMGTNDVTEHYQFNLWEDTDALFTVRIRASNLEYVDNGGGNNIKAAVNDTWYHIKVQWYADNTFDVYVDGTIEADGATMINNQTSGATHYRYRCFDDTTDYLYIDAPGTVGENSYASLDNYHIYIDKFEVGSNTVDLALRGARNIKRIGDNIADLDTFTWALTPSHAVVYTEGAIDSGINLATDNCWDIEGIEFVERFNSVLVKGGYTAVPERVYGTANNTDSQSTYNIRLVVRFYSDILTVAEANVIAASILTLQENAPKIVELTYRNDTAGFVQPVETVTVPPSTLQYDGNTTYVDAGEWLIAGNRYDAITGLSRLTLVNSLYFEYDWNLTEEQEALIAQK